MKNTTLLIIAIIAILAAFTNPDQYRHKEEKMKLKNHIQRSSGSTEDNLRKKAGRVIGNFFGGVVIDEMVDNLITTENYILFSTTTLTWEGESKVIGIGAFGNVYFTNELDRILASGKLK